MPLSRIALLTWVAVTLALGAFGEWSLRARVRNEAATLEAVALEAAASIDGAAHARVNGPDDPDFDTIRSTLRATMERDRLTSPMYTLRREGDHTVFVVMTNEVPYSGDPYVLHDAMRATFDRGEPARTGLYRDEHGWWVSAYAPIRNGNTVDALVEADLPGEALLRTRAWGWGRGFLAGLVAAVGVLIAPRLARFGLVRGMRMVVMGRLASQIGMVGALAVLAAVAVIGTIDHFQARRVRLDAAQDRLQLVVRDLAPLLDPTDVAAVIASNDATSDAFQRLRHALRLAQERAELDSPLYILRRDGDLARFVAMTNEVPFVGDPIALRPGLLVTFETGIEGREGPYTDAHGTWVSAWTPLRGADGRVLALIQADTRIDEILAELADEDMQRLMSAVFGLIVAFALAALLARRLAKPIADTASAARRIGEGDLTVSLPEGREDEVGELAGAVNAMSKGLRDRERIRDMFGRYMTRQVAERVLSETSALEVGGELREITVLISDIRGYTSLTERLGAGEVVALLNEYFAILVDAVVEQEGVIDKFMGDAMLCWFGAPLPQPDHAARAIRAAESIQRRLVAWNAERARGGLAPIMTGIGIASGEVIVGNIGSASRLEYTAIGEAVNLASRLCGKADGGVVLATVTVKKACGGGTWEEFGMTQVKGVKEPVDVWRLGAAP